MSLTSNRREWNIVKYRSIKYDPDKLDCVEITAIKVKLHMHKNKFDYNHYEETDSDKNNLRKLKVKMEHFYIF